MAFVELGWGECSWIETNYIDSSAWNPNFILSIVQVI